MIMFTPVRSSALSRLPTLTTRVEQAKAPLQQRGSTFAQSQAALDQGGSKCQHSQYYCGALGRPRKASGGFTPDK